MALSQTVSPSQNCAGMVYNMRRFQIVGTAEQWTDVRARDTQKTGRSNVTIRAEGTARLLKVVVARVETFVCSPVEWLVRCRTPNKKKGNHTRIFRK